MNGNSQGISIRHFGSYLPKNSVSNDQLHAQGINFDTSDSFFKGVNVRHWATEEETSLFMGAEAAKDALRNARKDPQEIDLIIVSALIGDFISPSPAAGIQHAIGANNARVINLDTGCASFVSGVNYGALLMKSGAFKNVLVISIANFAGRAQNKVKNSSAFIPGDGAGSVLLEASPDSCALLGHYERSYGQHHGMFAIHALDRNNQPVSPWTPHEQLAFYFDQHLVENLKENAREVVPDVMRGCLKEAKITAEEIDQLYTHQPNTFLLDYWRKAINVPPEKHHDTLEKYGNMFQACIPITINDSLKLNKLKPGQVVLMTSFAFAGEIAAASIFRYG